MNWLPPPEDFRGRLAAAAQDPAPLAALAALGNTRLSFLETLQLDAVLARAPAGLEPARLALLASGTVDHLLPGLRVAGLRHGLRITAHAGNYGQYRQELLDPGGLNAFRPDAVVLSLAARDFLGAVPLDASAEAADAAIAAALADLRALWARARGLGLVIQQTFLDLEPPLFGGLDAVVPGAPARLAARLNAAVADAAGADGVLLLDVARAAARDGLDAWHDNVRWLQAKMEIAPAAGPCWGELVARLVAAARGKSKKCLVLDLDNTLWGGVIGDDGLSGIVLGQGSGVGEAHLGLQAYAKRLRERGVILAVCSKNDPEIAEAAFRDHPEMLLKRADFAAFAANWDDKAANLRAIAQALNIGLDTLVFVDDNPAERARVRAALPEVAVPELPADPAHYVRTIAEAGYFEAVSFTADDRARAGQYAANLERESLAAGAGGIDEFLGALAMTVEFGPVNALNLARVTQLINKTNQFNTTTIRRTEAEVAALAADPRGLALQFRLLDRFGDNGIVSVMLLEPAGDALELVNWVMSCRVFGRQLEDEALNILADLARDRGVAAIRARLVPTPKNGVIAELFPRLGFRPDGEGRWTLTLEAHAARPTRISRKEAA
jgi:FkbH-like protein